MMAALLDHLWQSTLFAGSIALLIPLFRRQPAGLRFWLWFAASAKFLLPFSALTWLGRHVLAPQAPAPLLLATRPVAASLTGMASLVAPAPGTVPATDLALVVWAAGALVLALVCLSRWLELRAVVREAIPVALSLPVPVKAAASFLEPGLVGIWRPVILLPKGLAQQFEQAELDAILAHELCHLKRRDNLLAALHMLVEGLFWFHPLVWWLGARLMEERERACDEAVLGGGARPRDYAEAILKTCRFYVQSPLLCAAGVSGALEMRLGAIMAPRPVIALSAGKRLLLGLLGVTMLVLPLASGLVGTKPVALIAARIRTALAVPAPRAAATHLRGNSCSPAGATPAATSGSGAQSDPGHAGPVAAGGGIGARLPLAPAAAELPPQRTGGLSHGRGMGAAQGASSGRGSRRTQPGRNRLRTAARPHGA
jgi:bla regulator protein blaR1